MFWFYSKDEATNFNAGIDNDINFKSFKCKAKILEDANAKPTPNEANGIFKNVTIAASLKYLSNFWRLIEMLWINRKVELKLKWTKYCVLTAASADDNYANYNNIFFTIKNTIICSCNNFLSKRQSKTIKTS